MKLADCKPGARVRYFPIIGQQPGFVGIVREDPWLLGDKKTWVTHLCQMEPAYGEWRGHPRTTVHAALVVEALELVNP